MNPPTLSPELLAKLQQLDPAQVRKQLDKFLDIAAFAAKLTATNLDDQAVSLVRALVDTPGLLEYLLSLLQK